MKVLILLLPLCETLVAKNGYVFPMVEQELISFHHQVQMRPYCSNSFKTGLGLKSSMEKHARFLSK